MKIKLRDKRYKIIYRNLKGCWGDFTGPEKLIRIDRKARKKLLLDTYIHEFIHACFPDIDEDVVDKSAADIARILYKLGYRKR